MNIVRIIVVAFAVILVAIITIVGRFWWATRTPSVPKGWPQGSVWIWAPPAPLDWSPRGAFVGCWLDQQSDVNRCQFTDYQGKIADVADFTTCDSRSPLSDWQLKIHPADYADHSDGGYESLPWCCVYLENGTVLIPASVCKSRSQLEVPRR